jgi:hypothetical protein
MKNAVLPLILLLAACDGPAPAVMRADLDCG